LGVFDQNREGSICVKTQGVGRFDSRLRRRAERVALGVKADQVVRISAKPIYVFQALVQ
jgi:hypothetical protein